MTVSKSSTSNNSNKVTRTNFNSGNKAAKSAPRTKSKPGGGLFSRLFGSSFEKKAAKPSNTRAVKTPAMGISRKGKNGVAQITSYSKVGKRSQMASGTITVNGRTYKFNSGGGGKGNLPKGSYTVTKHRNSRSDKKTMMRDGVGYSFALNNKYDSRVKATRTHLRIHPDGGGAGTIGCIGIVGNGATQRAFRNDMNRELSGGGRYTLTVN